MANTNPSDAYFPPLDKCLTGARPVIPWATALQALSDYESAAEDDVLERFFKDDLTSDCLAKARNAFQKPSPETKTAFETRTAPIQVSQSANGDYDLGQMKEDALWLSRELDMSELSALRLVIVEWQQRPADLVLDRVRDDAQTAQLNGSTLGRSARVFGASTNGPQRPGPDFGNVGLRHQRLLETSRKELSALVECAAIFGATRAYEPREVHVAQTWIQEIGRAVQSKRATAAGDGSWAVVTVCIASLRQTLTQRDDPTKWDKVFQDDPSLHDVYVESMLRMMCYLLRTILANTYAIGSIPDAEVVKQWFEFMESVAFFQDLQSLSSAQAAIVPTIQSLVSIVSAAILKVPQTLAKLRGNAAPELTGVGYPRVGGRPYIEELSCVRDVNVIMGKATSAGLPIASPAIFAWSLITTLIRDVAKAVQSENMENDELYAGNDTPERQRPHQTPAPSAEELRFEALQDISLGEHRDDPSKFFLSTAVDALRVPAVMADFSNNIAVTFASAVDNDISVVGQNVLYELVREGLPVFAYTEDLLEAIFTLLTPSIPGTTLDASGAPLAQRFFTDIDTWGTYILDQAVARYPYELSPLLRLAIGLAKAPTAQSGDEHPVIQVLDHLNSFTAMAPDGFRSYILDHEEDGANGFRLTEPFSIFNLRPSLMYLSNRNPMALTLTSRDTANGILAIESDAPGVILRDSRPFVVKLEHNHSGLEYMGFLLMTLLPNAEFMPAMTGGELDRQTASEIVTLMASLLRQCNAVNEAFFILGRFGAALPDEVDIVAVLIEITETELLSHLDQEAQDGSLELLIACMEFFASLTYFSPERVWSTLSKSSLLGVNSGISALATVVNGCETQLGHYRFLSNCVLLYSNLVKDAVGGLVRRLPRVTRTGNRFDSPMEAPGQTPERTMSFVLNTFTKIVGEILQNSTEWAFAFTEERLLVTSTVVSSFSKLVNAAYGIGEKTVGQKRFTDVVRLAAETVVSAYASEGASATALKPLLASLALGGAIDDASLSTRQRYLLQHQTVGICELVGVLLRAGRANGTNISKLSAELIKLMPLFTQLFVLHPTFKASVAKLLTEILGNSGDDDSEPLSLLSQLPSHMARHFLRVLSNLDSPLKDADVESKIWNLLAAVLEGKQQWFSMYLLTGNLPRESVGGSDNSAGRKTMLLYALEQLADIKDMDFERAATMLDFVAKAQKTWVWATNHVRTHSDFLKNALIWLDALEPSPKSANSAEVLLTAREHVLAALVCDVFAVNLHASLEMGDTSVLDMLVPKLGFLSRNAVKVDAYNRSLHRNLADNFARRFQGCELVDFKRTSVNPSMLGDDYIYDRELASGILGHDPAWSGNVASRTAGFSDEFARANVNLSLMDAQIRLLDSWKSLATVLSGSVTAATQPILVNIAKSCLTANRDARNDEPGTAELLQTRLDLAFVLISRLVGARSTNEHIRDLLPIAWDLVKRCPMDFEIATAPEDLDYYRTLLQVLYLSIQPYTYMSAPQPASRNSNATGANGHVQFLDHAASVVLMDIVARTIAPGFRALCANLSGNVTLAQPGDFGLITALLRAILSVRGISQAHNQLAEIVANTSMFRSALSLYSWADQLAEATEHDPIYGEIAITFLVALSRVPQVAEAIALEGALAQLSSANLSNYFRKPGGKSPFDQPGRMFVIWTDGFLPLCLNLLDAVGSAVAAEISAFLNSFSPQLERAAKALQNASPTPRNPRAGAVTLGLMTEAHSLVLLSQILRSAISLGAAEGVSGGDIEELRYDFQGVRADVEALSRSERSLRDRITPANERELALKNMTVTGVSDDGLQQRVLKELLAITALVAE